MENKRLFFGFEVVAPWPENLPSGRILQEVDHHLTIAFLGKANLPQILELATAAPKPTFEIGLAGVFDRPVFLPHQSPHVAAWRIAWYEGEIQFLKFQRDIISYLREKGLDVKEKGGEFLPHVTIARSPFSIHEWKESFAKRPLFIRNFHLCESLGLSRYKICWTYSLFAPFEEKEHTADIAFTIRGKSLRQIHLHAQLALSFHFPPFVDYFSFEDVRDLDEIIRSLNQNLGKADEELGTPFKAVCYHGTLRGMKILEWEMIVDV